jgi:hypothetical protein
MVHIPAGLPRPTTLTKVAIQWPFAAGFPNHSYGLAGESRPKAGHPFPLKHAGYY